MGHFGQTWHTTFKATLNQMFSVVNRKLERITNKAHICGNSQTYGGKPFDQRPSTAFSLHKVDNPYSVTFLIETPTFEWYVVWCSAKNAYEKDMRSTEIGLHAHNLISILGSTVNIMAVNYMTNQ